MNRPHRSIALAAAPLALVLASAASSQAQQIAFAIGSDGSTLIRFPTSDPSDVTVVGAFSGDATSLDAIDFRTATGQLFGYSDADNAFFSVDPGTAQLTMQSVDPPSVETDTALLGMDFNPLIDRARVITTTNQNIVFNPNDGMAATFSPVYYDIGDGNEGANPNIIDIAYTQNFLGAATTQQYGIDSDLDVLVTVANNDGVLETVGGLGVDTGNYAGFDIFTDVGSDIAYAILTPDATGGPGQPAFYSIDLSTGAAVYLGDIGGSSQELYSLAVIPAPATAALLGVAGLGAAPRRQR